MKTSELINFDLDRAVGKCLGIEKVTRGRLGSAYCWDKWGRPIDFNPSTDWGVGGPIIEQEEIDVYCCESPKTGGGEWAAVITGTKAKGHGPTPLIAAMRCLVASKLGPDMPEEPEKT